MPITLLPYVSNPTGVTSLTLPVRAAFYYPWYPEAWSQQGYNLASNDPFTFYHPKAGWYNSVDDSARDLHVRALMRAQMHAGIFSWWGPSSYEDARFPGMLTKTAAMGSSLRWCLYYEMEGNIVSGYGTRGGTQGAPTAAQIAADLNYITTNYTSHPNYLYIGGKPVMFVYGDEATTADGADVCLRWKNAMALCNQQWYYVLKVFNLYDSDPNQPPNWHQYAPSSAIQNHGTHSYVISPGYWKRSDATAGLARLDDTTWATNVNSMVSSGADFQLITSFNEFGEGHPIENADNLGFSNQKTGWDTISGYGRYIDGLHTNLPRIYTDDPTLYPLTSLYPADNLYPQE